ncbi:hypothetical protein LEP1GSC112_4373 [Leptospira interrogans serovar Pomona str. UT364]|nr:hypothetical protein LEP1GSC106_1114 [Leptospira interrogans serovar Grippotyphosa str. UI 12764]EMO02247.1 hypothetical protein LEP1GSC112_4373 [Leptospira interrogans serovar Pomona str. UT364]
MTIYKNFYVFIKLTVGFWYYFQVSSRKELPLFIGDSKMVDHKVFGINS